LFGDGHDPLRVVSSLDGVAAILSGEKLTHSSPDGKPV
jgi:hypothetical protein